MNWLMLMMYGLMDKEDGNGGGGGGGPTGPTKEDFDKLMAANNSLLERLSTIEKGMKTKDDPPPEEDESLNEKARKEREDAEKRKSDAATLESALAFNLTSKQFFETHEEFLPEEIAEILVQANKEVYDSATEKASALKGSIVQSFFGVQDNLDLLTEAHKKQIDSFLKLTKNGRQQKAAEVYENIFEPALETLKKVKKAQELNKAGTTGNKHENAYRDKLINLSRDAYLQKKE